LQHRLSFPVLHGGWDGGRHDCFNLWRGSLGHPPGCPGGLDQLDLLGIDLRWYVSHKASLA
jgi:hypothetical protein